MRVEKPRFDEEGLWCDDCPYADEHGVTLCLGGPDDGCSGECPTIETYAEHCAKACRLAEQAETPDAP